MLQGVRDNLKGAIVVFVVIIFVVPMIISSVGSDFLGGVAGTNAATVNGDEISKYDLDRQVQQRRNQIVAQGQVNAADDKLSDENLRGPTLDVLIRRAALITSAKAAGMAASDKSFNDSVTQQTAFFTDGAFDTTKYVDLLSGAGYTPATYKAQVLSDLVLTQQASGLALSSFSTDAELEKIVGIIEQKRSYFAVKIPRASVADSVTVSDDDVQNFYKDNAERYRVPEKLKVNYLELSLADLASKIDVLESDIRAQYELEIANFVTDRQYTIAHVLIEDKSSASIAVVQKQILAGSDFAALAKEHSDDIVTSEDGGLLGVLTSGVYEKEFENAVYALEEGEVSSAIETEDGIHFVKVIELQKTDIPSFESRQAKISSEIASVQARDDYSINVDLLGELTFSSDGLDEAAKQLGLEVKTSAYFDERFGSGIAQDAKIRTAAFDDETRINGHNSQVVELADNKVVVVSIADRQETHIRPFIEIGAVIKETVLSERIVEVLKAKGQAVGEELKAGVAIADIAANGKYELKEYTLVTRSDPNALPELTHIAFSKAKTIEEQGVVVDSARGGDVWAVGVTEIVNATLAEVEDDKLNNYRNLLSNQNASFESSAYEASVVESADIKTSL
ncbi:MAG: peptidyl-prolyl cis-trans isomerase D [Flavobacteriales bacterium]|jgi:peptidyl-prolyl cis-trans isomerase D